MASLIRRRPTEAPAARADGAYLGEGGPTLAQLEDQDPGNPWRVTPAALPYLLGMLTDRDVVYKARVQYDDHQLYAAAGTVIGGGQANQFNRDAARGRAGMFATADELRYHYATLPWPPAVPMPARGWVWGVFLTLAQRAESAATNAAQRERVARDHLERSRCVVCGQAGGIRRLSPLLPASAVVSDYGRGPGEMRQVVMHDACERAVRFELDRRDHERLSQAAISWLG